MFLTWIETELILFWWVGRIKNKVHLSALVWQQLKYYRLPGAVPHQIEMEEKNILVLVKFSF